MNNNPSLFCHNCGTQISETNKFCPSCGAANQAVQPSSQQTNQADSAPSPQPFQSAQSNPVQQNVVIVAKQKSVGVAFLLAFLFGPLGLLYASVTGGIVMFFAAIIIGFITLGLGVIFVWIGCIIWAVVAAGNANKNMVVGAGLNINTNFSGQHRQPRHNQFNRDLRK